jgi:hypothetical protein
MNVKTEYSRDDGVSVVIAAQLCTFEEYGTDETADALSREVGKLTTLVGYMLERMPEDVQLEILNAVSYRKWIKGEE